MNSFANPYPLSNLVFHFTGDVSQKFSALASVPASVREELVNDVIAIRQAAAVALGKSPDEFRSISNLPASDVFDLVNYGPKPPRGLGDRLRAGRAFRESAIAAGRSGKLPELFAKIRPQVSLEARMAAEIAKHGGDENAAIAAIIARIEAGRIPAKDATPAASAPATTAAAPAPATKAIPEPPVLSARERLVESINAQFASPAPGAAVDLSAPGPQGRQRASAAFAQEFLRKPSTPSV